MASVRVWLIEQKSTGWFLPHNTTHMGITHTKPEDPSRVRPKLFMREDDAQAALVLWLMGKIYQRPNTVPGQTPFDDCIEITDMPVRHAMRDDMHVVFKDLAL